MDETTRERTEIAVDQQSVSHAAAATSPVGLHQIGGMKSGITTAILGPEALAAKQEGTNGLNGNASKAGTRHGESTDSKETKSKAGSIDASAMVAGSVEVGAANRTLSSTNVLNTAQQTVALATASAIPEVDQHERSLSKASSSTAITQIVGKGGERGNVVGDGTSSSTSVPSDALAPGSLGEAEDVPLSKGRSKVAQLTESTTEASVSSDMSSRIANFATKLIKGPLVSGVSSARKITGATLGASMPAAVGTGVLDDASSIGKEGRVAPMHAMQASTEEKKAVDVDDFESRAPVTWGETANQTPASSAPVLPGSGSTSLTAAPSASVVRNDAVVSSGNLSSMQHRTLQATPTVLEVGVPGGSHGWVKIRAEVGEGGAIRASISSPTASGQEALRRDLPDLSAYLEGEHVPVSVQLGHIQGIGGNPDSVKLAPGGTIAQALGDSSGAMTGAGAQHQSQREHPAAYPERILPDGGREARVGQANQELDDAGWSPGDGYATGGLVDGGNWLNVMA
ncbi:hypothetical protein [Granulicella sibirica]|nr:hypothetical protein [Granulicella sibirica]